MAAKRKGRTQSNKGRSRPAAQSSRAARPLKAPYEAAHTRLLDDWSSTWSSARAARGFHFQDVVGAWLAIRIADGELEGVLVPEGFDDLTLEGAGSTNVQVKSRQDRLGAFPLSVAAGYILDAMVGNAGREQPAARSSSFSSAEWTERH